MDDKTDKSLHYLCPVSEISEGRPKVFSIRNDKGVKTEVALFNIQGKFYAISNRCAAVLEEEVNLPFLSRGLVAFCPLFYDH